MLSAGILDTKTHQQKFSINGLKRGFYYVKVTILGALSIGDTRINVCSDVHLLKINGTDWPSNLDSSNHDSSNHESNPVLNRNDNLLVIFVIGLAAVGVISSFCYVIFRIRKYYLHHDERRPGETMPKKDLARKKVLLLYARDCPQFSDLMATFRELLKKNNFEVYDFYDPAHSRQVDENPTLWMKCLVKDSSVRVVVVSTKCAYLQQLTLTSGGFFYKKPHHLDHLFLYGLCDTMSVHTNIYQKIYSVAWEGFTQKEDTLSVLSDSRIYSLPTHLFELLRDLRHNTQTPEETAELRWQATILQEKLDILIRYTSAEKDYLRSIILTD